MLIYILFILLVVVTYSYLINKDVEHFNTINLQHNNQLCKLQVDLNSKQIHEKLYPVNLNCKRDTDQDSIFTVHKNKNNTYSFSKLLNNKLCYLIFSQDGPNRGFNVNNVMLSCNPSHLKYKDMVLSKCGNSYKVHPKLRKRCYLKSNRGVPVFNCWSTALGAFEIAPSVTFL